MNKLAFFTHSQWRRGSLVHALTQIQVTVSDTVLYLGGEIDWFLLHGNADRFVRGVHRQVKVWFPCHR